MNRIVCVFIQLSLAPITAASVILVFFDEDLATLEILVGVASFTAIFASLCFSASSHSHCSDKIFHFRHAGLFFLQATLMGVLAVIFHYSDNWVVQAELPEWLSSILNLLAGLAYGGMVGSGHWGLWSMSRASLSITS
jgi:hypothetical protein